MVESLATSAGCRESDPSRIQRCVSLTAGRNRTAMSRTRVASTAE
jgi:hypothetical protein